MTGQDKFQAAYSGNEAVVPDGSPPGADQIFPEVGRRIPVPRRQMVPTGALVKTIGENVQIGGITMTPKGLIVGESISLEDWEAAGNIFRQLERALAWIIGDWANCGQRAYGKGYDEAAELVGRSVKTVYNWANICGSVDFSRRREKLPFTHHAVVASLEPDAQEYFLAQAEDKGWSKRQLECAIEAWEKGENPDGDNSAYHDSETAKPSPLWSPVEWRSAKIRQTQLWNADKGVLPLSKKAHLQIIREQIAFLQSAEKRLTGE